MAMDETGKAVARVPVVDWSPADGDFVHHCPTYAITADTVDRLSDANQPAVTEAQSPEEKVERQEIA
jgi:hypothetical protein